MSENNEEAVKIQREKIHNDGEGDSDASHIEDLCSLDKNRISHLIAHLTKCTQEKNAAQSALAILKAENEELQNRNQYLRNGIEEKTQLELKLSEQSSEFTKLRQRTSHFLELLSKQIQVQEKEFTKLSETVKDLLQEKIFLQNSWIEKDMRMRIAEAQIERIKEQVEMEKLQLLKEQAKTIKSRMIDQACQTFQESVNVSSTPISSSSDTGLVTSEKQSRLDSFFQTSRQVQRTKSVNDLEEPSTDGNMIRDLFFKCPNFSDSETLQISPFATFYQ